MRHAKVELYAHLVWTTLDRMALLKGEPRRSLHRCLEDQARRLRCTVLAINGTADHVHVVLRYPASLAISKMVMQLKSVSSKLAHDELGLSVFEWQEGYGAFSLSRSHLEAAVPYVERQEEHHSRGSTWGQWEETYEEVEA